jgi:hypothetical protein
MFSSTFAYAILQSISYSGKKVELPKDFIIDYELSVDQENLLITRGITILKFHYNLTCDNCLKQKSFLEQLVLSAGYKGQLILEEILSEDKELPSLTIVSYYGGKTLVNETENKTIDTLCELMVAPPLECTLRKV